MTDVIQPAILEVLLDEISVKINRLRIVIETSDQMEIFSA